MRRTFELLSLCIAAGVLFSVWARRNENALWPQFHGPERRNSAPREKLAAPWRPEGPPLLWRYSGCGKGFSSVALADGMIFTAGDHGSEEFVIALDMRGKPLWKRSNGRSWRGATPGSRSTPTYYDGCVYHMNPTGRLAAFDAKTGRQLWALELKDRFGLAYGTWGMAESVAVDEKCVYCVPGGKQGRIVALSRHTGATIWTNTEIEDKAAYCSPALVRHHGRRQLLVLMQRALLAVAVQTGKTLWRFPHVTPYGVNVMTPLYRDGLLFISSGYRTGSRLLRIAPDSSGVSLLWENRDLDNCHGGVVLQEGYLYGSGCRKSKRGFVCLSYLSGRTMWWSPEVGKVSVVAAGGFIIGVTDKGVVFLIEPDPRECRVLCRFKLPPGPKDLCLAHPVVAGGRLYIRHDSDLFAYRVEPERKAP